MLEHLLNRLLLPYTESAIERQLLERGLIELVPEDASTADMALRYARNPLENIDLVNFEMTTRCDLHCLHCRTLSHMTEERRREITQQAEAFITRLESQYA